MNGTAASNTATASLDSNPAVTLTFDDSSLASDPILSRHRLRPKRAIGVTRPLDELRPDVLVTARKAWEERARAEYIGVMVVRHFHGLLVDANAPMDIQELAITMMLHEQRHTALCVGAARALGSD